VKFEKGRIASSAADHEDTLIVNNGFPWSIQGNVSFVPEYGWEILPQTTSFSSDKNTEIRLPIAIKLPSQTIIGEQLMAIEFNLGGSGLNYPFRVYRDYVVGLGDVHMEIKLIPQENGGMVVEQYITNETDPAEILDFRCSLLIRGQRRQTRNITTLVSGQTRRANYFIRDFEGLRQKDLWLKAEQKNGLRTLNEVLPEEQVYKLIERAEADSEPAEASPQTEPAR